MKYLTKNSMFKIIQNSEFRIQNFLFILCLIFFNLSWAQKAADDFFHTGGALYIEGRMQQAVIEVEDGLRKFPDDPKLKALHDQLKQLEDQQKQDNQPEQEQGEDQEDEQEQEEQDQQEQETESEPEDEQDTTSSAEEEEPPPEEEMSEEDAKRLLDAYKDDEKEDQEKMRRRKQSKVNIDW
jgi:single-stranded DNA-binding protein